MKHIVKRKGHTEQYDERKLFASVYSACFAVREPEASAELIASQVVKNVNDWLSNKKEVTSGDIFRNAYKQLNVLHPDAAYIYQRRSKVSW